MSVSMSAVPASGSKSGARAVNTPRADPPGFRNALVDAGLINHQQLAAALDHSSRQGTTFAEAVVALGFSKERDVYMALAKACGLEYVDLTAVTPSALALRLIPEKVARRHFILPVREDNRTLTYAVTHPYDADAERDVSFVSGRQATAALAVPSQMREALDRCYATINEVELLMARVRAEAIVESIDPVASGPSNSAVVELCNHILAGAVTCGASDVHIEPSVDTITVRYRVGGILETVLTLPAQAFRQVINRFKVLGNADISVRFRPQDGAWRAVVNGRPVYVRLSTLPTVHGEKLVMRVIDGHAQLKTLDSLGYEASNLERLRRALARPDGLILVTGPTGSGKTTVLYAALNHLRTGHTNIVTVEDPVERNVEGVNQIAVNGRGGNTFPAVLKAVMRQDPNVIMVGEIRDAEVAQIVGQAAYTGHLVLSSVHTADSASAITRLLNLGLEPFKVAESLAAIVSQRLVRQLCPICKTHHDDLEAKRLGREHGIDRVPASAGPGCDRCRQTGYVERVPVAEVLTPDQGLRTAIAEGASATDIRAAMKAAGCASMREAALALVERGITSLDEIDRVLATGESELAAPARQGGRRVLIADDDPMLRTLVKLLLEKEGYVVTEAENGGQAVEFARRQRPDLLMIDLTMPEKDGYEAIADLRRDLNFASIPILVLTAETGPGTEQRVLDLGADDYLNKPFQPPVLMARVRALFRRQQSVAA